ncbi:homing endonuclease associated repeat-containing protein, partial [Leptospira bandrabouensis]|uniref:homing endonuclease associated repeat-containing protein n=2 Tax=Leptospira TaxID=171 RepID=UPI001EE7B7AE
IIVRFGGWNKAVEKAGLSLVHLRNISEKDLFENIEYVWLKIGKQPVFRDIKSPISKYPRAQYVSRFGTWRKALESFIEFINTPSDENSVEELIGKSSPNDLTSEPIIKHKTKRYPSERLKVQVLMRDGNKCKLCGITLTGDNIHFDHIIPWSKGGETVLENLQVLCSKHNLAKSNLEYPKK